MRTKAPLTMSKVADMLGVNRSTIWRSVRDGNIPFIAIPGKDGRIIRRIPAEWVEKHLQEQFFKKGEAPEDKRQTQRLNKLLKKAS